MAGFVRTISIGERSEGQTRHAGGTKSGRVFPGSSGCASMLSRCVIRYRAGGGGTNSTLSTADSNRRRNVVAHDRRSWRSPWRGSDGSGQLRTR